MSKRNLDRNHNRSKMDNMNQRSGASLQLASSGKDAWSSPSDLGSPIRCMSIKVRPTSEISPRPGNPRKHSPKQIKQIAQSILRHGFVAPILVDEQGVIIAGEGRWRAATSLKLAKVPTVAVAGLSDEEIRTYVVADNQLALKADWDVELLTADLKAFESTGIDLEMLGFDASEVDVFFDRQASKGGLDQEPVQLPDSSLPAICQVGDRWRLGRHILVCADSRDEASYRALLERRKAQMVFTDPPYNVAINGHVSGSGSIKHREFVMASGEMSQPEFRAFLDRALSNMARFSEDGSIHFVCMDWRHTQDLLAVALPIYTEWKNLCVWTKTNAGLGNFYRSRHELIFAFKYGKKPHINNFGLGQYGRSRSNIWEYAGANTLTRERLEELALHPTVKPVALVADAIKDCSKRGGLILDPFCGSGSTVLAAEITGRSCAALELDPQYVDVTIRRWQKATGEVAIHCQSGKSFEQHERSARRVKKAAHG